MMAQKSPDYVKTSTHCRTASDDLLSAQVRVTTQRLAMLESLGDESVALTASQIHDRLREQGHPIGLATVYRNLAVLEEAGVLHSITVGTEQAYSRCVEDEHDHARCYRCNRVIQLAGLGVENRARLMMHAQGMDLISASVEIVGICVACKQAGADYR